MKVFKFGGSSLANAAAIRQVIDIIASHQGQRVVVVSAMYKITDCLVALCDKALQGDFCSESLDFFKQTHEEAIENLISTDAKDHFIKELEDTTIELYELAKSISTLRDLTPKVRDRVTSKGEFLSSKILCQALKETSHNAAWINAAEIIEIAEKHGVSFPNLEKTKNNCKQKLKPQLSQNDIIICPGFVGQNPQGELITLGRGGTDLSGSILAACLEAESLTLYKEVDGLMTADPRLVPEARIVHHMHYREAAELAYYGAKVLHPRTIIPLIQPQIPLLIKNTFSPQTRGTEISSNAGPSEFPVKALSAIDGQAIISIEGNGMMGVPGIAGRAFSALASKKISVSLITQASSESSICFTVSSAKSEQALTLLEETFAFERQQHLIEKVSSSQGQTIIALVGMGMGGTRGIASQAFSALADEKINIQAIAQGSSELNISLVICEKDKEAALRCLHRSFRLEKFRSIYSPESGAVSLHVYGFGQIGRTLGKQLKHQNPYYKDKLNIDCQITSLSDSSGLLTHKKPFNYRQVQELARFKNRGGKLRNVVNYSSGPVTNDELHTKIFNHAFEKGIFVDLTASETSATLMQAIDAKLHVVLANKKPLAIPFEEYTALLQKVEEKGVQLRYEATVGAGLPVLDTLVKLSEVGDSVKTILGCFSGTLGYIMSALESGQSFSAAVESAFSNGFTEPDPRDDLSGMDVARKALILARTLGYKVNIEDIALESLYSENHSSDDPHQFINNLKGADEEWSQRVKKAETDGKVVRYVASISPDGIKVGIEAIEKKSPIGQLKGTDNLIQIQTQMYDSNPLVLTGPGAGAEVTAAGVLNDIMAIATSTRRH